MEVKTQEQIEADVKARCKDEQQQVCDELLRGKQTEEAKAKKTAEEAKAVRARAAAIARAEIAEWYKDVEHVYGCDYRHCLKGGPDNFRLELVGLTAEQVKALLNLAADLRVVHGRD